jgi:hypothetical protein
MSNRELTLLVEKLVRNKYPDVTACVMFGSQHTGSTSAASDIDLMLFGEVVERSTHEHQRLAGWLFDIYRFNPEMFETLVRQQLSISDSYFFGALTDGAILFDDEGVARILAVKIQAIKASFLNRSVDWRPVRLALTCLVNDVRFPKCEIDKNACCVELYKVLLKANALKANVSQGPAQIIAKNLSIDNFEAIQKLDSAFSQSINGDVEDLLIQGSEMLTRIGGAFGPGERIYLEGHARTSHESKLTK